MLLGAPHLPAVVHPRPASGSAGAARTPSSRWRRSGAPPHARCLRAARRNRPWCRRRAPRPARAATRRVACAPRTARPRRTPRPAAPAGATQEAHGAATRARGAARWRRLQPLTAARGAGRNRTPARARVSEDPGWPRGCRDRCALRCPRAAARRARPRAKADDRAAPPIRARPRPR